MKKESVSSARNSKFKLTLILLISLTLLFFILKTFSLVKEINFFISSLVLALLTLLGFFAIDKIFDAGFKTKHYLFMAIIVLASFILGSPFYFAYPHYDKLLHFIQPIMFSSIVFYLVNKLNIKLKWKLAFTFFIIAGFLGMFEIAEFGLDRLFDMKLQGVFVANLQKAGSLSIIIDPLSDTHMDMFFGILGALAYSIFSAFYPRKKKDSQLKKT